MESETGTDPEAGPVTDTGTALVPGQVDLARDTVVTASAQPADVDSVESLLDQVDGALARLDDGSYGRCESCGTLIVDDRLAETPTARTCATCPVPLPG